MKTRLLNLLLAVRHSLSNALLKFNQLPRRQQWLLGLFVLALLAGAGLWLARSSTEGPAAVSAAGAGPRDGRPVPVAVAVVKQGDLDVLLNALGTVTALNTVTVKPRVDGQLHRVLFKEGQWVKAGEVLAEIDPRPFQIALDQARGQLMRDQALLANAKIDLARYQGLLEKDAISRQQVDTQAALVRQYEGTVKGDQAQVDNAALQLDFAKVKAPVAGRLGLRLVDVGNMVKSADASGLVVLTQTQPISVVFALPSDSFPSVLQRWLNGETLRVDAWSRDNKIKLATGKLLTVDNQIDAATGTVRLKAVFENGDNSLFPNQFVNVRLRAETRQGVLLMPEAAVQRGTQGAFVYVVEAPAAIPATDTPPAEGKSDGKPALPTVAMKKVVLGPAEGGQIMIEEGLVAGDKVVIDGLDKLRNGAKVNVLDPESARGKGSKGGKGGKEDKSSDKAKSDKGADKTAEKSENAQK